MMNPGELSSCTSDGEQHGEDGAARHLHHRLVLQLLDQPRTATSTMNQLGSSRQQEQHTLSQGTEARGPACRPNQNPKLHTTRVRFDERGTSYSMLCPRHRWPARDSRR